MSKTGRASKYSEVVRADRLGELFDLAYEHIKFELKEGDRKWATEQVMKLAAKTVPTQTELTGRDGGPIKVTPIYGGVSNMNVQEHNGNQENIQPDKKD